MEITRDSDRKVEAQLQDQPRDSNSDHKINHSDLGLFHFSFFQVIFSF